MCLLKPLDNDEPCNHPECKVFASANRLNCIFNNNQAN